MLNVFVDKASGLEFPWESYDPTQIDYERNPSNWRHAAVPQN
jgi:hypothetical protein